MRSWCRSMAASSSGRSSDWTPYARISMRRGYRRAPDGGGMTRPPGVVRSPRGDARVFGASGGGEVRGATGRQMTVSASR
ncbi:hypothetical protein GCM10009759_53530 [Kitasatospora saccharophila]|uniref:Uncharacterized protein n=1 Tax=Kitasatospora saccharophila TaxID=407973 RepID=A0ABN2XH44_9ACTN